MVAFMRNRTLVSKPFGVLFFLLGLSFSSVLASAAVSTYHINCGGPAFDGPRWVDTVADPNSTDTTKIHWSGDAYYIGGGPYSQPTTIKNTASQPLFQTERWNPDPPDGAKYTFPVPNGNYTLTLYFAEISPTEAGVGLRVFNVMVNGSEMLHLYDIFAKVGANKATSESKVVYVTAGKIEISFVNVAHHAKISAIQIVPVTVSGVQKAERSKHSLHSVPGVIAGKKGGYTLLGKRVLRKH